MTLNPTDGDSIQDIFQKFIEVILYAPIDIQIYPDYIRVFRYPGMNIYNNWLLPEERAFVAELFVNRLEYFKIKNFYANGTFHLAGECTGDFPIERRRELIRDFVGVVGVVYKDKLFVQYVMLYVVQQLLLRKDHDVFIDDMHDALQGKFDLKNILCVSIGRR